MVIGDYQGYAGTEKERPRFICIVNGKRETDSEMAVSFQKRSENTCRCAKFYKHRAIKLFHKNPLR
jgi:hypothetical protein